MNRPPWVDHDPEPDPEEDAARFARGLRNGIKYGLILWIVIFALIAGMYAAFAHDALPSAAQPKGWQYPYSCCSGVDCREAIDGTIQETPAGYRYTVTGDIVAYMGDARLRNSPDGKFHICTVAGAVDGRILCLFSPPRGM